METNNTLKNYLSAFFFSAFLSIIVAHVLAIISSSAEKEYIAALAAGAIAVAFPIRVNVPRNSPIGMVMGAVMVLITYLLYNEFLESFGMEYEFPFMFWVIAIVSVLFGGFLGLNVPTDAEDGNGDDDDDDDSDDRQAERGDDVDDDDEFIADAKYNKNF